MRRIIKRFIRTVTTVTWTIHWDEAEADVEKPFNRQKSENGPEPANPALAQDQLPLKTSDVGAEKKLSDAGM